jgi:G3E family GTPase
MSQQSPIPVVIIGGYLGSGKTTLINHCLQNGLSNAAIIVNDFGDINIDAALISQYSSDTLELTNGCICCSIGESLADTFFAILDRPRLPELIVVETSGVSDPSAVAAYGYIKGLTNAGILVLVDALQAVSIFNQPFIKNSFERQIRAAHVLAITKTDVASAADIEATEDLLRQLAPTTPIIQASATALVQMIDMPAPTAVPPSALSQDHQLSRSTHSFDCDTTASDVRAFLENLAPQIIRVKGIVELADTSRVLVQKTGPHLSITPTTLPSTGLVLLATN